MDPIFLHDSLRKTRLDRRAVRLDSGDILFDAPDRKGPVRFTAADWASTQSWHAALTEPATRFFRWALVLNAPITLGLMVLLPRVAPGWRDLVHAMEQIVSPFLFLVLFMSWPAIVGLLVSLRATIRANRALDRLVADRPREAVVLPKRRFFHGLELLALAFIGPRLILGLYGTLNPDAYYNTPLSGTQLGWIDLVGVGVLAVMVILRRKGPAILPDPAPAAALDPPPTTAPLASTFGRRPHPPQTDPA